MTRSDASESPQAGTEPAVTPTPAAQPQPAAPVAEASYNPPVSQSAGSTPSETADGLLWKVTPRGKTVRVTATDSERTVYMADAPTEAAARAAVAAQIKALSGQKEG